MALESDIDKLIERQQPGQTLEQVFYRSPEIYQLEFRRVLSLQWLYVAHESELPESGDFITYDIAEDSIIVVRGWIDNCAHSLMFVVIGDPRSALKKVEIRDVLFAPIMRGATILMGNWYQPGICLVIFNMLITDYIAVR